MLLEPAPAAAGTGCLCAPAAASASDAACPRLVGAEAFGLARHSEWRVF